MSAPNDVIIGGQRYLLVGAKGKTVTKFPSVKKSKPPAKPSKKVDENKRKKEAHLRQLALLIKKPKLTGEEKDELDDLSKIYPTEAKALRAQLPKDHKQKVEKTEDEQGEDFADSLTSDDDEEDDDEDEGGAEEKKIEPKKPASKTQTKISPTPPQPKEEKQEKKKPEPKPEKKGPAKKGPAKKGKGGKKGKGRGEEPTGQVEEPKSKKNVLDSLLNAQGDDEDEDEFPKTKGKKGKGKGKGGFGFDDEEDGDPTTVEKLNTATSKSKADSMFKELSEDIDYEDDPLDLIQRKKDFQGSLTKEVGIGLDEDENEERRHLLKKKDSVGLHPHEKRRLQHLESHFTPQTMHYDDLDPGEQKEMRKKWVEDKAKELLKQNEKDIEDNESAHEMARSVGRGEKLGPAAFEHMKAMVKANPEKMKAIFNRHGVDLSIPEEEGHPPSWKPIHNKEHLDGETIDHAIVEYHILHEKSKKGDYDAQQKLKKLKKVLDNPLNMDADARRSLDDSGIKTSWNPDPSGGEDHFNEEHETILKAQQKHEKEVEEKARKEKEDDEDSELEDFDVFNRKRDDVVDQYHRLYYQSKSKDPLKAKRAKRALEDLQKAFDSKKAPQELKDRLDAEGIPTKDNPNPTGKDVHDVKQWREQNLERQKQEKAQREKREKEESKKKQEDGPEAGPTSKPEFKSKEEEEDSYESVDDYYKGVKKCPPGYRRDPEKKKCVVRDDAKKDEVWKPKKEREDQGKGQTQEKQDPQKAQEAAIAKGSNVSKAMGAFEGLSMPSQKKVLDHAAAGTADLAEHLQKAKPEQRKTVLSMLKRVCQAIKPHIPLIFKTHKDRAQAIGSAISKAHHVAVLGKNTKSWSPEKMSAKSVDSAIDNIDKAAA
jgi:hypothetical protein